MEVTPEVSEEVLEAIEKTRFLLLPDSVYKPKEKGSAATTLLDRLGGPAPLKAVINDFYDQVGEVKLTALLMFCPALSCSVLPCSWSVLLCHGLSCSVMVCPALSWSVLLCHVLSCSVLFCSVLFCPALTCPVLSSPFLSVLFCCILFRSIAFRSVPFPFPFLFRSVLAPACPCQLRTAPYLLCLPAPDCPLPAPTWPPVQLEVHEMTVMFFEGVNMHDQRERQVK